MTTDEFIKKWNVAFEDKEQQLEFAAEMQRDLQLVIKWHNLDRDIAVWFEKYELRRQARKISKQFAICPFGCCILTPDGVIIDRDSFAEKWNYDNDEYWNNYYDDETNW